MKVLIVAALSLAALGIAACVSSWLLNPRVIRELREQPDGERAEKVMLLSLPSGKTIPVNYLREGDRVYAAADFPWWRELREGGRVRVLLRGESLEGHGRAVLEEPERRASVFARLRPTAPSWTGTLVEIALDADASRDEESSAGAAVGR